MATASKTIDPERWSPEEESYIFDEEFGPDPDMGAPMREAREEMAKHQPTRIPKPSSEAGGRSMQDRSVGSSIPTLRRFHNQRVVRTFAPSGMHPPEQKRETLAERQTTTSSAHHHSGQVPRMPRPTNINHRLHHRRLPKPADGPSVQAEAYYKDGDGQNWRITKYTNGAMVVSKQWGKGAYIHQGNVGDQLLGGRTVMLPPGFDPDGADWVVKNKSADRQGAWPSNHKTLKRKKRSKSLPSKQGKPVRFAKGKGPSCS